MNGGEAIAAVLERHGVQQVFTLCGGHIAPILVGCKARGIGVIDVRHEVTAVFAADAVGRLRGTPGVAVVTAGPGLTNTVTAVKNAQLAESPVLVLGGATATVLRGRGSLQDIDQLRLMRPHVKWAASVRRARQLVPTLERALARCQADVPGPVFVEVPLDLLYDETLVRKMYLDMAKGGAGRSLIGAGLELYLRGHLRRLFAGAGSVSLSAPRERAPRSAPALLVGRAASWLAQAERPVLLIGSHGMLRPREADRLAAAVRTLAVPTYLAGMARGLLGRDCPHAFRHHRKAALRQADLVIQAGVPNDFRLDYGLQVARRARRVMVSRRPAELVRNRLPSLPVHADPATFLLQLAERTAWRPRDGRWLAALTERERERDAQIRIHAEQHTDGVNPLALALAIERAMADDAVIAVDGGDFVATASYVLEPRGPLSWLDPGVFGTLGVGAGFALGAALCRPRAELWLLYGDGSAGYSLAEFDTFVRHRIPVIAVVGNDAGWSQIAREQVDLLGDDVGTVLLRSDYHKVAQGLGAEGLLIERPEEVDEVLGAAKKAAARGRPVLVNAHIGRTDFRKGSISM